MARSAFTLAALASAAVPGLEVDHAGQVADPDYDAAVLGGADGRAWLVRVPRTRSADTRLRAELARLRRQGWAQDKGEMVLSIHAFAAPVFDTRSEMVAALSVPFLAGTDPDRMEDIRLATIATARALTTAIPGPVAR